MMLSRVRVRVRCFYDLGYKRWSQKTRVPHSLVYSSVKTALSYVSFDALPACDGQTDM